MELWMSCRIPATVSPGTRSPYAVFEKDRNGGNHFTLFEALLGLYGKNALIMPFPILPNPDSRFSPPNQSSGK
jgi:hypothetical protein